jgi:hypothetical protein
MEKSEQINELITALVKFQGAVSPVVMNKEAKIVFEKNGKWIDKSYRYADLGAIFEAIRKPLSESGLAISQFPSVDQGEVIVQTMLFHTSGQFIKETLKMKPADVKIQSIGSTITYGKRYSISAILGISTEDDDDGSAGNGNDMDQRLPADRRPPATGRPAQQPLAPAQQPAPASQPGPRPTRGNPRRATAPQQPQKTATPVTSALPVGVTPATDDLPWDPNEQQNPDGFKAPPLPDENKLVGKTAYDRIVIGIKLKKIKVDNWRKWLMEEYKADSAQGLSEEQQNAIVDVIYNHTELIDPGECF